MKFVILAALAAVALAAPQYSEYRPPTTRAESHEHIEVLRDDREHEEDGKYNFDFESENGIRFSEGGSPDGPENTIVSAGQYSFIAPDGTEVVVKYVANENGFQPQSDHLPVAPEFPHPIPEFVLEQIAFAEEEDRLRALEKSHERPSVRAPSGTYGAPQ
ncbi:hypothetical protein SK128_001386 [Halocaridina rubra]|uniref:Uncharacterized protein n=1 Tax=Halocaridina rubra TaxID=373956 RepID=A0AAN8X5L2_HALRR